MMASIFPTSFVTANGAARPILASRAYFHAVEKNSRTIMQ